MYYVLGSGSISDKDYEQIKTSQYFLGSVGPDAKADYEPVIIWLSILQIQIQIITSYRQAVLLRGTICISREPSVFWKDWLKRRSDLF